MQDMGFKGNMKLLKLLSGHLYTLIYRLCCSFISNWRNYFFRTNNEFGNILNLNKSTKSDQRLPNPGKLIGSGGGGVVVTLVVIWVKSSNPENVAA